MELSPSGARQSPRLCDTSCVMENLWKAIVMAIMVVIQVGFLRWLHIF